jgi:hypothetical protein
MLASSPLAAAQIAELIGKPTPALMTAEEAAAEFFACEPAVTRALFQSVPVVPTPMSAPHHGPQL